MSQIHIYYPNGQMHINLEGFFPASVQQMNKLSKVIELSEYQNQEKTVDEILMYLRQAPQLEEQIAKDYAKFYMKSRQKQVELFDMVQSKKHPNGLPLTKDELKEYKAELKAQKQLVRSQLSDHNRHLKLSERLSKNYDWMQQRWCDK